MLSLRVVEFYAGAGGFHFSLQRSSILFDIVASIDINTNTNQVYQNNFPHTPHLNRNICGLTTNELDDLRADVYVLSPPCQPFTRQGQRRDNLDTRTDSFFHLMQLLTQMKALPSYLLMENVKGFESSQTRDHFTATLTALGYNYHEFLLSPAQFGVPNSRLRYYLLAKRKPLKLGLSSLDQPCYDAGPLLQFVQDLSSSHHENKVVGSIKSTVHVAAEKQDKSSPSFTETDIERLSIAENISPSTTPTCSVAPTDIHPLDSKHVSMESQAVVKVQEYAQKLQPVSFYLEVLTEEQQSQYLVPDKLLLKYAVAMDIVRPSCTRSCCFTRAYGHYAVGTGSVLQVCGGVEELDVAFKGYKKALEESKSGAECDPMSFLRPLKLRYFTPREVANLMCFPSSFVFPASLSTVQCYKVMGNSLNVLVVSVLMQYLFSE